MKVTPSFAMIAVVAIRYMPIHNAINSNIDTLRMFNEAPEIYTWWDMITRARDRNVGWRIDYFFISESLKNNIKNAFTLPDVKGSDHCPVGIEIEI